MPDLAERLAGVRVAVLEDSKWLRESYVQQLTAAGAVVTLQEAAAGPFLAGLAVAAPDVALVDIRLDRGTDQSGLTAALTIRERHPGVGVLVVTNLDDASLALRMLESPGTGGIGYLVKDKIAGIDELIDKVLTVRHGDRAFSDELWQRLMHRQRRGLPDQAMTGREAEVLRMVAQGLTNHAIARKLYLSETAVEKTIKAIFRKLDLGEDDPKMVNRRVLAVIAYLRQFE